MNNKECNVFIEFGKLTPVISINETTNLDELFSSLENSFKGKDITVKDIDTYIKYNCSISLSIMRSIKLLVEVVDDMNCNHVNACDYCDVMYKPLTALTCSLIDDLGSLNYLYDSLKKAELFEPEYRHLKHLVNITYDAILTNSATLRMSTMQHINFKHKFDGNNYSIRLYVTALILKYVAAYKNWRFNDGTDDEV